MRAFACLRPEASTDLGGMIVVLDDTPGSGVRNVQHKVDPCFSRALAKDD